MRILPFINSPFTKSRPIDEPVFATNRAEELADLTANIDKFLTLSFKPAPTIGTIKPVHFSNGLVNYLHHCRSLFRSQKNRLYNS